MVDILDRLPGYCGCGPEKQEPCPACDAALEITRLRGEVAKQKRIVEIKTQALKRYAPCPDHGGKAQGGCLLCRAEAAEAKVERLKTELDFFNDYVPKLKTKFGWNAAIEASAILVNDQFGDPEIADTIRNLKRG